MPTESKYDICKQYSAGFAAALALDASRVLFSNGNPHYEAGYKAGYATRPEKNTKLDAYLVSIGHEPQLEIRAI